MTVIVHRLKHQYYPSPLAIAKKPSPPPQNNGDANDVVVGYDGEASTVEYFVDADFDDKHGDGDDSVDNHRRRRRRPRHYHRRRDHSPRASQTISMDEKSDGSFNLLHLRHTSFDTLVIYTIA